jgi:hypothetical protein
MGGDPKKRLVNKQRRIKVMRKRFTADEPLSVLFVASVLSFCFPYLHVNVFLQSLSYTCTPSLPLSLLPSFSFHDHLIPAFSNEFFILPIRPLHPSITRQQGRANVLHPPAAVFIPELVGEVLKERRDDFLLEGREGLRDLHGRRRGET